MGNLSELWFMLRFYLQTNPLRAWRMIPVAYNMFRRNRISVKARKLTRQGSCQLRSILDKAGSLGGV
jgi:hypothetical protein